MPSVFSRMMDPRTWFGDNKAKPARRPQGPQSTPGRTQTSRSQPTDQRVSSQGKKGKAVAECKIPQSEDTHIHQYSNDKNVKALSETARQREAQANCGPSSAAIVLRSMGLKAPSLHALRTSVGAVTGNQKSGVYAIDPGQLIAMVEQAAAKQGHKVHGTFIDLPRDAKAAWDQLQGRIYVGMPTVLLTGNMSSRGPGHYVVIDGARSDKLQINDPQFEDGHDRQHDFQEFKAAFERRQKLGRPNRIISFMPDLAKAGR